MRAQKNMQKAPVANYTSLQGQLSRELWEGRSGAAAPPNALGLVYPSPLNDTEPANLMTWTLPQRQTGSSRNFQREVDQTSPVHWKLGAWAK